MIARIDHDFPDEMLRFEICLLAWMAWRFRIHLSTLTGDGSGGRGGPAAVCARAATLKALRESIQYQDTFLSRPRRTKRLYRFIAPDGVDAGWSALSTVDAGRLLGIHHTGVVKIQNRFRCLPKDDEFKLRVESAVESFRAKWASESGETENPNAC